MIDGWGVQSIRVTCPFWTAWQEAVIQTALPHQWRMCEETGRIENFRRAACRDEGGHQGFYYNDSDVHKWAEAAAYASMVDPDSPSRQSLAEIAGLIDQAQLDDGYISTYFQLGRLEQRWKSLAAKHEMYCIGHLIEAGVACATVESRLLDAAHRAAGHVASVFGPDRRLGYCGHQEIELALCRLADHSGEPSYRELARWMTERRGGRPSPFEAELSDPEALAITPGYGRLVAPEGVYDGAYLQDDRPLAEQTEPVGHAVRAMYQYCGALDSDVQRWLPALRTIWDEMVRSRVYVTGGIGSAPGTEGFAAPFDLPTRNAYAETCAAVGLVFWASRMSRATGRSEYADWLERALVNAVMSGISLAGDRYFYDNPLASVGDRERKPWFDCACCPPNVARLVLSVGKYLVWADQAQVTVDVPASLEFVAWPAGIRTVVEVRSDWPWGGAVSVTVRPDRAVRFALRLRVPAWCEGTQARCGEETARIEDGYLVVDREWTGGETLEATFEKRPTWVSSDPRVAESIGKLALVDGPVVWCLEETDLGAPVTLFKPDVTLPVRVEPSSDPRLTSAAVEGSVVDPGSDPLYRHLGPIARQSRTTRMIPSFAWANRGRGSMAVWLNGR